jgi:FkbM family methyltransferase
MLEFFLRGAVWVFINLVRIAYLFRSKHNHLAHIIDAADIRFEIPEATQYVRVDVGLSDDASHSVECLFDDNRDRLIIGIEPHPESVRNLWSGVSKFYSVSLASELIRKGNLVKKIPGLRSRFLIIQGAAGSCALPSKRIFFSAFPDRGNSSLYNIQTPASTGNINDSQFEVTEFPLSIVLERLKSQGVSFVESLKIDTEGHELEVLKGAGELLDMVLYCRVECFKGVYPNTQFAIRSNQPPHIKLADGGFHDSASEIIAFLDKYNFRLISSKPGDYVFLNESLRSLLNEHEVFP